MMTGIRAGAFCKSLKCEPQLAGVEASGVIVTWDIGVEGVVIAVVFGIDFAQAAEQRLAAYLYSADRCITSPAVAVLRTG